MNDMPKSEVKKKQSLTNPGWISALFLKPRKTVSEIAKIDKSVWSLPLIILSILVIILALISAPIKKQAIEMGNNLPPDFQYYSPEMQAQFLEAQASQTSPLFLYVFPILFGVLGIWISWFILSSILHLVITLSGSRASNTRSYNLSAWSMLPLAIRLVVQIVAVLVNKQPVTNPGISYLIEADATGLKAYLHSILEFVDIYFLIQVILLFIGSVPLSGLKRGKAWLAVLITLIIVMLIRGLPGLLSSVFSGLSLTRSFFYF